MKKEGKKKTLEDYLIERIKKSGYPLEIEISNLLDHKYVIFNAQYYFDEEAKQGRDIDIYAIPLILETDNLGEMEKKLVPFMLRTEIAIECKKSETHAWVFYNVHNIPVSGYHISGQFKITVPEPREWSADSFQWLLKKCLNLHYYEFERVAVAYDEIKKKGDGSSRREIFEAINQLVKFVCYEIHQILSRISRSSKTSDREFVIVFFPIIVFDGDMFEVTFDSGEPKIDRRNHVILRTHYRCPYCQEVESFLVDVVHRSYFSEFIKILRTDFYEIRKNMLQNYDELVKGAKETRIKCVKESGKLSVEK